MLETKKAFRNLNKRGSLESAAQALCNLKGVGPTMASGISEDAQHKNDSLGIIHTCH